MAQLVVIPISGLADFNLYAKREEVLCHSGKSHITASILNLGGAPAQMVVVDIRKEAKMVFVAFHSLVCTQ